MRRAAFGVILTLFAVGAALQALRIVRDAGEQMQLDYGEGVVLSQASQVFHLREAFHSPQQYPYLVFNYAPFYPLAVRVLTGVLRDPLLSGRAISMAAAFWLAGLLGWAVLQATRGYADNRGRWMGAAWTWACVLQLPTMRWAPLARVDLLGLALQFTGLGILCVKPFRLRNQVTAFCLLLLGVYTKQSLLAVPAASILLIAAIRPRRAIGLACEFLAAGLSIFGMLAWATDGGVIQHWITYNMDPFHWDNAILRIRDFAMPVTALIAAGLAAMWVTLRGAKRVVWRRFKGSMLRRTGLGFGLAAVLGFVTSFGIGKDGANMNYCLDWQLALCPLTGLLLVLLLRDWKQQDRGIAFLRPVLALLLLAAVVQLGMPALFDSISGLGWTRGARADRLEARREEAELVRAIAAFPGPVVSENIMALIRAGKPVPFDPFKIKGVTEAGIFDERPLLKQTADRFFDAFILTPDYYRLRFSPRMIEAIRQNYRLTAFDGKSYLVYVRR